MRRARQRHNIAGMRHRVRPENQRIHHAECRGRHPDPQRQRHHHEGRQACGSAQAANREAHILHQRIQERARARIAHVYLHLLHSAQFDARGALRFGWRHARANLFFDQHFQVGTNFLVEVCIHAAGEEQIAQKTSGFHK